MRADSRREETAGPPRFLGVALERHGAIASTNDEAFRRAAEGAPEGLTIVAESQTAGRGRQGRVWRDTPGASLLFSTLLKPRLPLPTYPLLALAVADAVAGAGEAATGVPLAVKWPNDVLHGGRKLCGILAEARAIAPGEAAAVVVGVGVNVNQLPADFPPEVRELATSLRLAAAGRPVDRESLLAAILDRFESHVALARRGDPEPLLAALRPRLPATGSSVRILQGDRAIEGTVEAVTETGALRVRDRTSGRVELVAAGVEA